MEFKEMYLIDCVNDIIDYRGKTPKKLKDNWSEDGDYRAISAKNIKNMNLVNQNSMNKAKASLYKKWMKKEIDKGDILLTSEAPLGETLYWDFEEKIILSQRVFGLKVNNEIVNSKYLFAYMQTPFFKHELFSRESGTTVTGIRRKELEKIVIKVPSMYIQNYIGQIIYNINYKINNNNKIIANLEELSQTLFKRWFVDFEFPDEDGNPYKSSGGEMIDSELGDIPNRWKIGTLSDIAEIVMGQSPKSNTYNNEQVGLPLLNGASDFKNKNIQPAKYTSMPKKIGHNLDYVFGVRATIGLVTELDNDYAIGRGAGICKSNKETREFIYEVLNRAFKYFERIGSGSVYINISSKDLKQFKLIIPSKQALMEYHYHLEPIFSEIRNLKKQVKLLINMRDSLLPKLMSGEIKIPDDIEVNTDELSI